jgi:hypothetical protein
MYKKIKIKNRINKKSRRSEFQDLASKFLIYGKKPMVSLSSPIATLACETRGGSNWWRITKKKKEKYDFQFGPTC